MTPGCPHSEELRFFWSPWVPTLTCTYTHRHNNEDKIVKTLFFFKSLLIKIKPHQVSQSKWANGLGLRGRSTLWSSGLSHKGYYRASWSSGSDLLWDKRSVRHSADHSHPGLVPKGDRVRWMGPKECWVKGVAVPPPLWGLESWRV